jgi:hypothetical protein
VLVLPSLYLSNDCDRDLQSGKGYLIKGLIDIDRLVDAIGRTVKHFPLFAGTVCKASTPEEPWKIELIDQAIPLEIVHGHSSDYMPHEGVVQPEWKWSPPLDVESIRSGRGPHLLAKMRLTILDDLGWSIIGLTHSHVIGWFVFAFAIMVWFSLPMIV